MPSLLAKRTKPKVDKREEHFYGNYDRKANGTWKHGLDHQSIHLDDQALYDDNVTSYKNTSYNNDRYGSCYVLTNSVSEQDK